MLKSYLRIAIRNLSKYRLYSMVNIAGLSIGITACLMIGMYVYNELTFDHFHKNADRIARVTMEYSSSGNLNRAAVTGTKVGPDFHRRFPEVTAFTRTIKTNRILSVDEKVFKENNVLFADSAFFSIFSFPLLRGDPITCLNTPGKLVITRSIAMKYFGTEDAIGKIIKVANSPDMTISGIVEDVPGNSQLRFDLVMPFMGLKVAKQEEQWFTANYVTYLLLTSSDKFSTLQQQISSYMKEVSVRELFTEEKGYLTHHLEPLKTVHLGSSLTGIEPNGNKANVYILSIIAFLILIIACVNYTNLSVVQSTGRSVEVGIRKVLGAKKNQLLLQFLGESFILTSIAVIISVVLSVALIPFFNTITGLSVDSSKFFSLPLLIMIACIVVVISSVSGLYPARLLSSTKSGIAMKSGTRISHAGGMLRKTMIVFQFVVSVVLIASTIIVTRQLSFIRNKDLGYQTDHLLVLPTDRIMMQHYEDLKNAIAAIPGVASITGAYETPTFIEWSDGISVETGKEKKDLSVSAIPVDLGFVETIGAKLISGRDFSMSDLALMDTTENYTHYQHSFILNEKAVAELGWTPEEAIGKTISKGSKGIVRGVVKNFNFSSLHENIGPLVIFLAPDFTNHILVKINSNNIPTTISNLERLWEKRITHRPFEYKFLDEEFSAMYTEEQRTAKIFSIFSALAIFLACLGLFALAAFTTVQRTKEIGIRKVLGASITEIILLLSKEFLLMVFIAILVATPISWYMGNIWLQDFAFRMEIGSSVFVFASAIALFIALLSVTIQAFKAANANPVNSLRTE